MYNPSQNQEVILLLWAGPAEGSLEPVGSLGRQTAFALSQPLSTSMPAQATGKNKKVRTSEASFAAGWLYTYRHQGFVLLCTVQQPGAMMCQEQRRRIKCPKSYPPSLFCYEHCCGRALPSYSQREMPQEKEAETPC